MIVGKRINTFIHDVDKEADMSLNMFWTKRDFTACRPTDAVSNHKGVDLLPKIDVRACTKLNIAKKST